MIRSRLSNRYGHFEDGPFGALGAYRITDSNTPMPWVNVICNGRFGLVVSQRGGGFSWFDDAQHCVITRWDMDMVKDQSGKHLYLSDLDSGDIWSVAPAPCNSVYDEYACIHQPGSTTFETKVHGINSVWTLGVAEDDDGICTPGGPGKGAELWTLALTNTTSHVRTIRVASYLEWSCGVAPDTKREFHRLFLDTRFDASRRAIIATKTMWDIPPKGEKDHWNVGWPYVAAHAVKCDRFTREIAIGDKEKFLGRYGQLHAPAAMKKNATMLEGGFGRFADQVGALGGDLVIKPGETVHVSYVLAIAMDEKNVLALVDRYAGYEKAHAAIASSIRAWKGRIGSTQLKTGRADFDTMVGTWLPYQAISGRMWGRTGYYQQSGAFGFRDQLQDCQTWLPLDPAKCLSHILVAAGRQFEDGSVNHWWHTLADFGNHTACSDDYLWLAFVTCAYLRETGDFASLAKNIRYMPGGYKAPAAKGSIGAMGTLLDHCIRAIERANSRMSARGLPFIGSCDWNDGLSAVGVEERGESIWLAMFLAEVLREMAHVLEVVGDGGRAAEYKTRRLALINAINAHAWDGSWYRCASKDDGEWIGSSENEAGKIHLNPQTWSILADIAPQPRADQAWASVQSRLLQAYGPLLSSPAYTKPDASVGYITRYSPGSRENGGVYMHAATWALMAAAKRRDVTTVEQIWSSTCPALRCSDVGSGTNAIGSDEIQGASAADAYFAEPYVTPGNVDGPLSDTPGRAGWTWYTGSAGWMQRAALEWVLGIRPTWRGLLIEPCPPKSLEMVDVERVWRGVKVRVRFDARLFHAGHSARLTVNGNRIKGNEIDASLALAASASGTPLDVLVSWDAGDEVRAQEMQGAGAYSPANASSARTPEQKNGRASQ